jgi:hypothetical protein
MINANKTLVALAARNISKGLNKEQADSIAEMYSSIPNSEEFVNTVKTVLPHVMIDKTFVSAWEVLESDIAFTIMDVCNERDIDMQYFESLGYTTILTLSKAHDSVFKALKSKK